MTASNRNFPRLASPRSGNRGNSIKRRAMPPDKPPGSMPVFAMSVQQIIECSVLQ
jgi:hypothetical protein